MMCHASRTHQFWSLVGGRRSPAIVNHRRNRRGHPLRAERFTNYPVQWRLVCGNNSYLNYCRIVFNFLAKPSTSVAAIPKLTRAGHLFTPCAGGQWRRATRSNAPPSPSARNPKIALHLVLRWFELGAPG